MDSVDDTSKALAGTAHGIEDSLPSLLTVIIDTNALAWKKIEATGVLSLAQAVESILVFINGHISQSNLNRVCVIAADTSGARFLYPSRHEMVGDKNKINNARTMYRQFREVNETTLQELDRLLADDSRRMGKYRSSAVSGALSCALSYMNRVCGLSSESGAPPLMSSRIFLLSVSGDMAHQYIPAMNCIFAAQKKRIPIDVCKLGGDSVFLQQACDSTNGVYLKVDHPRGLIQYLMGAFSVEPGLRQHVNLATQRDVDFRAACFVTKRIVDIGFVCSVCLCIISFLPEDMHCPMCDTEFDRPATLEQLRSLKKPVVTMRKKKKRRREDEA